MAEIPDYQTLMLPLLTYASEGEMTIPRAVEKIGHEFGLSEDQLLERTASGKIEVVNNRAHWAKTYLAKAGLLEQPRRGVFKATERGQAIMRSNPHRIDNKMLSQFPEFVKFVSPNAQRDVDEGRKAARPQAKEALQTLLEVTSSPSDRIETAIGELRSALLDDLLKRIFSIEPQAVRARFFERLVIKLLIAMGYGGGKEEAAFHVGGRGDGGVDGVIHQDALGLDPVYVQAKCYERDNSIGPEQIQAFKGALDDKGAIRGVFITTAKFSDAAQKSGRASQKQVALIDGHKLAELMERFNVGAQIERSITIKKLDEDFFED